MALRRALTLEELLAKTSDEELLDIEEELLAAVVPTDGYTHAFRRRLNKMIDRGELCINPNTYRKIYLPTLYKAVQKELARRYIAVVLSGAIQPDSLEV